MKLDVAEMTKLRNRAFARADLIVSYSEGRVILCNHLRADTRL
jgi:hypothetical protein